MDFQALLKPARSGNLRTDLAAYLTTRGFPATAGHCAAVGAGARRLAARFGEDPARAEAAGLLHDISAPIPDVERIATAEAWGLEVLAEERAYPMIIHQKLSAVIAREAFGVTDAGVLSAIGCHTTLKAGAIRLDKVVFVADKIAWDQPGDPPYLAEILAGVERSLDAAAFCYLDYLHQRQATLRVAHPWMLAAWGELYWQAISPGCAGGYRLPN
ncbi:MAG: bis(5'-nucleosyl)-tetraphosphatase (symmetrical) YqeK [Thermoflexales bacterium]